MDNAAISTRRNKSTDVVLGGKKTVDVIFNHYQSWESPALLCCFVSLEYKASQKASIQSLE